MHRLKIPCMVANPDQMNAHVSTELAGICALPRGKGEDRREHDEEKRKLQVEVQVQAGFKVRLHTGRADRCRTLPKSDSAHLQPAEVALSTLTTTTTMAKSTGWDPVLLISQASPHPHCELLDTDLYPRSSPSRRYTTSPSPSSSPQCSPSSPNSDR